MPDQVQQERIPQDAACLKMCILEHKDFPFQAYPLNELFCELVHRTDNNSEASLFFTSGLLKETGVDFMGVDEDMLRRRLMKLRVRRREAGGVSTVLWHVVLPLLPLSKYLLNPPYQWETWIGLFGCQQSLDVHPAETMLTQSVHLISRPEFPKLRIRFVYLNDALKERNILQLQAQEQESWRKHQMAEAMGMQSFKELCKLRSWRLDDRNAAEMSDGEQARQREAVAACVRGLNELRLAVPQDPDAPPLPALSMEEVQANPSVVDSRTKQIIAMTKKGANGGAGGVPLVEAGLRGLWNTVNTFSQSEELRPQSSQLHVSLHEAQTA